MAVLTSTYIDLNNLNSTATPAKYFPGPNDILQRCPLHLIEGATSWDQVMSAMACVAKWSPTSMFSQIVTSCDCEGQDNAKVLQGVAFLGMAGLLVIGKAASDVNKSYLTKRWMAYCEGSSITNEISPAGLDGLIRVVMMVQPKLHQTATGREWAKRVIDSECNPLGIKAQVLMIYDYVGMKASQVMYKYLSTAPLDLVLPNVIDDARRFKAAYEAVKAARGEQDFP